ncbi:MAG: hypothetical protein M1816_003000 [Peltula sp. TS41687]|nr:MAG: hypothetical protein M1816_003000 [Peltula sp. TS41687]
MVAQRTSRETSSQPVNDLEEQLLMSLNQARRLSRSPHSFNQRKSRPYDEGDGPYFANPSTECLAPADDALLPCYSYHVNEHHPESDGRARPKDSNTSSASGIEADDESPMLLKRLPPPPLVQRKGLRGTQNVDQDSPAVTPVFLSDVGRSLPEGYRRHQGLLAGQQEHSEEIREKVEKYRKRRRGELLRRLLETGLVGVVGGIVLQREEVWCKTWDIIRVLLYPLRVLYYLTGYTPAVGFNLRKKFRISSSFDPAPLLYPVFLPVFIALSLQTASARVVLSNVILSLSSIPSRLVPGGGSQGYCSVVHWSIASLPLIVARTAFFQYQANHTLESAANNITDLPAEYLSGLYPLHQSLRDVLREVTSTSLLPAETDLLTTGFINLLIHSRSPQAVILKALILGGGTSILIFCGPVLRWGITLARIPKWRFRRAGRTIRAGNVFYRLSERPKNPEHDRDSDADEDGPPGVSTRTGYQNLRPAFGNPYGKKVQPLVGAQVNDTVPLNVDLDEAKMNGGTTALLDISNGRSQRHASFMTDGATEQKSDDLDRATRRQQRSSFFYVHSYLSLTPSQALFRKSFYAGYVYLTVILIVFLGIRPYIERYALNDHEPFGWAIGYLAGNIRWLRFNTVKSNLERWICLPSSEDTNPPSSSSLVEDIRQHSLGAANTRLALISYYLVVLVAGIGTVFRLRNLVEVDTRRKIFHGIMVVMFLPSTFIDPIFAGFSMIIVLAIFLLLEILRASQLPPLSKPLATFLTPYVDGRDLRGPIVVSHIFLLIGCAVPLWLSLSSIGRTGRGCWTGWDVERRDAGMVSGVICVGMGDAAASLIGRRFGRRKWPWSGGKSIEGSLAFWVAVTFGLCVASAWLWLGGWPNANHADTWVKTMSKSMLAAALASLTEAVLTGGNDNVIVPIVLWLLVRGLRI